MPDSAGGRGEAPAATVAAVEGPPNPEKVLQRLQADVVMCQRVLDELKDGAKRQDRKRVEVAAIYKEKAAEVNRMIDAAKDALKDAQQALQEAEG